MLFRKVSYANEKFRKKTKVEVVKMVVKSIFASELWATTESQGKNIQAEEIR